MKKNKLDGIHRSWFSIQFPFFPARWRNLHPLSSTKDLCETQPDECTSVHQNRLLGRFKNRKVLELILQPPSSKQLNNEAIKLLESGPAAAMLDTFYTLCLISLCPQSVSALLKWLSNNEDRLPRGAASACHSLALLNGFNGWHLVTW